MLYKNLLLVPFVLNTLNSPRSVQSGSDLQYEDIIVSKSEYACTSGSDYCRIYCDTAGDSKDDPISPYALSCGDVEECYFYCEEKDCVSTTSSSGTIDAASANNLYVIATAEDCMKDSTVYTPSNGNATFTMTFKKGFKDMSIRSGSNTQNIIVNCDADISDAKDDCKDMNINAETANYLEINIGNYQELKESTIICPKDSDYNGPNEASCVIDATNNGIIKDTEVYSENGIPRDLWLGTTGAYSIENFVIKCLYNGEYDTWPEFDNCCNTINPTKYPSFNPTLIPTLIPTNRPTKVPTTPSPILHIDVQPTPSPTDNEQSVIENTMNIDPTIAQENLTGVKGMSVDVEIVLITVGVLLVVLCICLFLCYWYRKEKYYKDILHDQQRSVHLSNPLMTPGPGTAYYNNTVQMHMFDHNDAHLFPPNATQHVAEHSLNSDDSYAGVYRPYKATDSTLTVPNITEKSHGESISLQDGESMDAMDLEIVDEINRQHTKGEEIDGVDIDKYLVGSEGVKKKKNTDISVLTTYCDVVDDDIDDIDAFEDDDAREISKGNGATLTEGFIE